MAIAMMIFGVTFAGFCVWLTVRIVNRRERWAKWMAVGIFVVFGLYPLSAGPGTWIIHHCDLPKPAYRFILNLYSPLGYIQINLPAHARDAFAGYQGFFVNLGGRSRLVDDD